MSLVQITKSGTIFSGKEEDLNCLYTKFNQNHCIKLSNFLEPGLLQFIQNELDKDGFYKDKYKVGKDKAVGFLPKNKTVNSLLHFLTNEQTLFQLIQKITGCPQIGCFTGRVYSKIPNQGQYDSWHDDLTDNRMISISINLSKEIYSGGFLQILESKSGKIIHEIANTGFGDAIIFRLSQDLKHRVSKVDGTVTRTTFTGWFRSKPIYKPIFSPLIKQRTSNLKIKSQKLNLTASKYSTITIHKKLFFRNIKDQILIFNPDNTKCFALNGIGTKILDLLKEQVTITDIQDAILKEYDVESNQCKQDIQSLLQEFLINGFIVIREKGSAHQVPEKQLTPVKI